MAAFTALGGQSLTYQGSFDAADVTAITEQCTPNGGGQPAQLTTAYQGGTARRLNITASAADLAAIYPAIKAAVEARLGSNWSLDYDTAAVTA